MLVVRTISSSATLSVSPFAASGLEVSPGGFLQDQVVQGLIGHQTLQATVLLFQLLQTMDLGHFPAAVFHTPAVVGLFPDTEMASSLDDSLALGDQNLSLSEMTDDLFCCVTLPCQDDPFLCHIS